MQYFPDGAFLSVKLDSRDPLTRPPCPPQPPVGCTIPTKIITVSLNYFSLGFSIDITVTVLVSVRVDFEFDFHYRFLEPITASNKHRSCNAGTAMYIHTAKTCNKNLGPIFDSLDNCTTWGVRNCTTSWGPIFTLQNQGFLSSFGPNLRFGVFVFFSIRHFLSYFLLLPRCLKIPRF